jgi:hypothetical protein
MTWEERHTVLAALRDLFAMPIAGLVSLYGFGWFLWLSSGSTSAGSNGFFCGTGSTLLFFGAIAAWLGVIVGSLKLARERSTTARALLAVWNGVLAAPLLFVVLISFLVGVAACNE